MPKFSKTSQLKLDSCHKDLQLLFEDVIKDFDCTVLCGYRNETDQNKAHDEGKSKLKYPNSRHNLYPSAAVDVAPYPIDWNDIKRFYFFSGWVMCKAKQMGIKVRWGGNWKGDYNFKDNKFNDLVHFELILP
jgi:peptidoglycan L-alanyl-D-glutamate endopeptidase CwlK